MLSSASEQYCLLAKRLKGVETVKLVEGSVKENACFTLLVSIQSRDEMSSLQFAEQFLMPSVFGWAGLKS